MRRLARRAFCGVLAAVLAAAAVCPAYAMRPSPAPRRVAGRSRGSSRPCAGSVRINVMGTRFVVGLDSKVDYQIFSLSNPNRVIVELPEVNVQLPTLAGNMPVRSRQIVSRRTRGAGQNPHRDRRHPAGHRRKLENRAREGRAISPRTCNPAGGRRSRIIQTARALRSRPALARSACCSNRRCRVAPKVPKERAAKTFKPIIVLDPGHGGYDSGAEKLGTIEKDVVLAFGLVLRDLLEKTGRYKVMMTRSDDTFIPLDERTAFAERNKANLFIAIHADYSDEGSRARGATIYSLRDGVAKSLERSAKGNSAEKVLTEGEIDIGQKRQRRCRYRQRYSRRSRQSRP